MDLTGVLASAQFGMDKKCETLTISHTPDNFPT